MIEIPSVAASVAESVRLLASMTRLGLMTLDVARSHVVEMDAPVPAVADDVHLVRFLVEEIGANPNQRNDDGFTALCVACLMGYQRTAEYLLGLPGIQTDMVA